MVLMIPGDKKYETGNAMPTREMVDAMMKYNEELTRAGILLGLDGLHPTAKGARIAFGGGKTSVTDGPFGHGKEVIGGYWIWQVKSREEAIAWASRCPANDGDAIELRQIFDASDFVGMDLANDPVTQRVEAGVEANRRRTTSS
jgi:hypothetical protein